MALFNFFKSKKGSNEVPPIQTSEPSMVIDIQTQESEAETVPPSFLNTCSSYSFLCHRLAD